MKYFFQFCDTINAFTDGKAHLQRRSEKFSKWVKSVDFFDNLTDQQKVSSSCFEASFQSLYFQIDTVKMSFTVFDRLERAQMSVKMFGESCITEKVIINYKMENIN